MVSFTTVESPVILTDFYTIEIPTNQVRDLEFAILGKALGNSQNIHTFFLFQNMDTPVYFLVFGIFAAGLYLFYSRQMNKTYVGTLLATLKERLFLPDKHMYSDLQGGGEQTLKEIMRGINNPDEEISVAFAKVLVGSFPDKAAGIILERAGNMETATADRALSLLAPLELSAYTDELHQLASNGDSHLQTTVMRLLLDKNHKASMSEAIAQLDSSNPRMLSTAIHAALRYPDAHNDRHKAIAAWQSLLQSNTASRCAAMDGVRALRLTAR